MGIVLVQKLVKEYPSFRLNEVSCWDCTNQYNPNLLPNRDGFGFIVFISNRRFLFLYMLQCCQMSNIKELRDEYFKC